MKKVLRAFSLVVFLGFYPFWAQARVVRGGVTDEENGHPLSGVSVGVKGLDKQTTTSEQGLFVLSVPDDAKVLVFRCVGMKILETEITDQMVYNVVLKRDEQTLDEAIVVAYGWSRKEAATGAIGVVKNNEIQDLPQESFEKMLAGKVAGLMVTGESGQPGSLSEVRVRGFSSLNAGNDPLYVVDGIPMISVKEGHGEVVAGNQFFTNSNNPLTSINSDDIESITLLKDAAAAAIYGSRAANGVVLITTKSGKPAKSEVKFCAKKGFNTLANDNHFGIMSPAQLVEYMRTAVVNAGYDPDDPTSGGGLYYVPKSLLSLPQVNWMDVVTRNGSINEYEASVSGGDAKTRHFTSASYYNSEGIFYDFGFKKYQLRSNLDHIVNERLKSGTKINLVRSEMEDVTMQTLNYSNPLISGLLIAPWTPVKNEDGSYNLNIPENGYVNPLASAKYDDQWNKRFHVQANAYLEWKPFEELTFRTNNGCEYIEGEGRMYHSKAADFQGKTYLMTLNTKHVQYTTSNTLSYRKDFGKHVVSGLVGQEALLKQANWYSIYSPDVSDQIPYLNTGLASKDQVGYGENDYSMVSFFGMVDYSYDDRYLFKGSLRTDGSSKFGVNNRWGTFYSVGSSWNIHREAFLKDIRGINLLKWRASYGTSGNDNISTYEQWGLYSFNQYSNAIGVYPSQPSNPNLTWEKNRALDLGIDFSFWDRVGGSIDFYNRVTTDMLLDVSLSATSGYTSQRLNIGKLRNRGLEATLNVNVLKGVFKWDVGGNWFSNSSKILSLGGQKQISDPDGSLIYKVGEHLYSFYLKDYAGVNPANGEALWYDENGKITNNYLSASTKIVGSPEPKFMGGFYTRFTWKGVSLGVDFEYKYGNKVVLNEMYYLNSDGFSWGTNQVSSALDYWENVGDLAKNPKPIAGNSTNSNGMLSSRWMYDGSYLRIKNLMLAYNLPATLLHRVRVSGVRVYTCATNLYTFHRVDYFDPERGTKGLGLGTYPMTKSFTAGLDVTF